MAGGAYGEGPDPEESAHTTAMLSENTCTAEELQGRPHTATAITTGTISFAAMWHCRHDSGHCTWNQ